jgi:hypothetical protein
MGDNMKSFDWHIDAGHEWLEVDLDYLMMKGLANKPTQFSFYSKKTNKAYLEGDMDAGIIYRFMGEDWNNDGAKVVDYGMPLYNPVRNMKRFPMV